MAGVSFSVPPRLPSSLAEDFYPARQYGGLDSGFNSVDSGSKRWSGNEVRGALQAWWVGAPRPFPPLGEGASLRPGLSPP